MGYRVIVSSARFSPLNGELNKFRIQKIHNWFDDFGIEIDEIRYHVPAAELSIDDLGWRFPADWQTLESELLTKWPHGLMDKRLSVALDCVIGPDGADTGAATTLERLSQAGAKFVISMGPWLEDDDVDALHHEVRQQLENANLWPMRIETTKVAFDAYVSHQAYRFQGDCMVAMAQIGAMLGQR